MSKDKSYKNFMFTCYDFKNFIVPDDFEHFKYCVYQPETCPKTGRDHYQGFCQMARGLRATKIQELFNVPGMHLDAMRGTPEEARTYCTSKIYKGKDKGAWACGACEFGTFDPTAKGERTDLSEFVAAIDAGLKPWELKEQFPTQTFMYNKKILDYQVIEKPVAREPPQVHVRWGTTDSGKTRFIFDNFPIEDIFRMEANYQWFNGYIGQPIVLFDEFYCQFKIGTILQLLDRYPMIVPVKGGFANWNPKTIFITSNVAPDLWYTGCPQSTRDALARRITSVTQVLLPTE